MSETITIRPACAGADIRDPVTGDPLPEEGVAKPRDPFWLALLMRGDVVEIADPPPAPPEDPEPAPRKR